MSDKPHYTDLNVPGTTGGTYPGWRRHQTQLLEWFQCDAPSLADPYRASVTLMSDRTFPARVHLICHIVRDIYSKLPEALDGSYRRREANEVSNAIDNMAPHWEPYRREPFHEANGPEPAAGKGNGVLVSSIAVRGVAELLSLRQAIKSQPTSAEVLARALFQRFVESGVAPPNRLIKTFVQERQWFTNRAHLVRDSDKLPSDEGLGEHFESFERTLHSLVAPHFTVQQELNDILQQANQ